MNWVMSMRIWKTLLILAILAPPVLAADWCDRADPARLNDTERTICANLALRDLDTRMGALFYGIRDGLTGAERARLEREQFRTWLPYRDACGDGFDCLRLRYTARMGELSGNLGTAAAPFTMLPDGRIKTVHASGITTIYDPATGRSVDYGPDGNALPKAKAIQVGTLDLPALPGDDEFLSRTVAFRVKNMSELFFDEGQRETLRAAEPDDFLGYVKFYVGAVNHVLELQQ